MCLERLKLFVTLCAFTPRLELNKKGGVVTGANKAQEAEAHKRGRVLHPRCVHDDFFYIGNNRGRTFQRRSVWKLNIDIGIALIFIREKAGRKMARKESCRDPK